MGMEDALSITAGRKGQWSQEFVPSALRGRILRHFDMAVVELSVVGSVRAGSPEAARIAPEASWHLCFPMMGDKGVTLLPGDWCSAAAGVLPQTHHGP
jgi:hypothetical protein